MKEKKIGKSWIEQLDSAPINIWSEFPSPKKLEKMMKELLKRDNKNPDKLITPSEAKLIASGEYKIISVGRRSCDYVIVPKTFEL